MLVYTIFLTSFFVSIVAIMISISLSRKLDFIDLPSGHKKHESPVPFVGGFGIVTSLFFFLGFIWHSYETIDQRALLTLASCSLLVFMTGLSDDRWRLSARSRLAIEAIAAGLMIWGAGIVLDNFGELVPGASIKLGLIGIPVTLFCMAGVTNALNMIDGIDGLAGSLSFVSLILVATMAYLGGNDLAFLLALSLTGAVMGFLVFNMRFFRRRCAHVYLGDNGSMLIGFTLGWLFIDLSQGDNAIMAPVTALYLFSLPLFDSILIIVRRLWLGKSPLRADRYHLHHMMLESGASVQTTVYLITLLHLGIGLLGVMGFYFGVSESLMFGFYLVMFFIYGYMVVRRWRFVPLMRKVLLKLGFSLEQSTGVYVGRFDFDDMSSILAQTCSALPSKKSIRTFCKQTPSQEADSAFIVVELESWYDVRPTINLLRKHISNKGEIEIRQYVERNPANDRRGVERRVQHERRTGDLRNSHAILELATVCTRPIYTADGISYVIQLEKLPNG